MTASITQQGETIFIDFNSYGIGEYETFLRVKKLPESKIHFDENTFNYRVETHARYANLLGFEADHKTFDALPLSEFLFEHQKEILKLALNAKRYAVWADCGLGKTLIELEFARQVHALTGGRSLILTLPEVAAQTLEECKTFYGKDFPLLFLETKEDMRRWCEKGDNVYKSVAITNYEKMNLQGNAKIIPEIKNLAGFIVDENRLKSGGGKQKWAIIHSSKGIPYKLTATATPAPNDTIEFASQASFLERMRNDGEIIWTYFQRDKETKEWTVKRHARQAFFEWMAAWSIYIRNPQTFGWKFDVPPPPDPVIFKYEIPINEFQLDASKPYNATATGQMCLFPVKPQGMVNRGKLSQIGKGFVYKKSEKSRLTERIKSLKPPFIANLVRQETSLGLQTIVWTVFDEESEILAKEIRRDDCILTGKTSPEARARMLKEFRAGTKNLLISNSDVLGYGMNLQAVGSMIFSGWNDSFEDWYQTIRRAVRFGQKKAVRIHIPFIRELEYDQLENILRKEATFNQTVEEQEKAYLSAMRNLKLLQ